MSSPAAPSHKFLGLPVSRKNLLELLGILLLLYVIVPQLSVFRKSLTAASHADGWWLLLGILFMLATYLAATVNYWLLAQKPLRYWRTLSIEAASTCVDRILPVGIGAMGMNFVYLRKNRHTAGEATAVVAANTIIGVVGLVSLIAAAMLINHTVVSQLRLPHVADRVYAIVGAVLLVALVVILGFRKMRERVTRAVRHIRDSLAAYRNRPWRLLGAFISSMVLTLLYSASLLACARATGLHESFAHVLLILGLGGVGGTIAPTPGGLIGVEAGLTAGFIAYGASSASALTATLLYRLVTYWFALLLGIIAFVLIGGKGYLKQ